MKRIVWLAPFLLFLCAAPARSQTPYPNAYGFCEAGAQTVLTSGLSSSTQVQASFPQCQISVSIHGGGPAIIYSNDSGTPLANPFTATTSGQWQFFAATGSYDITLTCASACVPPSPSPFPVTFSEVNIGGGGGSGTGVTAVTATAPILSSGGTTPVISCPTCNTSSSGPQLNTDNAWTNNNRFYATDPYFDPTVLMPTGGCPDDGLSLTPEQGTISQGTPNLSLTFQNGIINGCGVFIAGAGPQSTLATPSQGGAPAPVVVGGVGSTTIHYKIAAIDGITCNNPALTCTGGGTSAASSAITVTTAPSTRTAINYVSISWSAVANAAGYLIYSDQTGGGTYVPLGYSFDCFGYSAGSVCSGIDKGVETNSFGTYQSYWPTTPPAAATYDALITTVKSGGGTDALILNANAQNSVTNAFTFPDNSPFFSATIAAASVAGPLGSPANQYNKGIVQIPPGLWFTSTIPFPSANSSGVIIRLQGKLEVFDLPIEGPLAATGASGDIVIDGSQGGGTYVKGDWSIPCANVWGYPTLGSVFVVANNGSLNLNNICTYHPQTGIVQAPQGYINGRDNQFVREGSGPAVRIDNNAFFTLWDRTNWNASAGCTNDNIPEIWFLGLTNTGHSSVFDFRDNSFICHAVRVDQPAAGGPTGGTLVFDGTTDIEDGEVNGFIESVGCNLPQGMTLDNIASGDVLGNAESLLYVYGSCSGTNPNINVHGQTSGFTAGIFNESTPYPSQFTCRNLTYENPNSGGSGLDSIGLWGNNFATYYGCDLGATLYGYDVQTTEVLCGGGNDPLGPAGEECPGAVFRRPVTTLTPGGGGSLSSGTYYIVVTVLDAAGRESAPSPEQSATVSASGSIAVSSATATYFPASCNVYYGTAAGGEAHYYNSTSISNGTCTYTLSAASGTAKSPSPVGNAMRTWLTLENNANSCLFCGGAAGALGTGFLGFNLTATQYASPPSGIQFYLNGKVAWAGLATTGTIAGALCQDAAGNIISNASANCFSASANGISNQVSQTVPLGCTLTTICATSSITDNGTTVATAEPVAVTNTVTATQFISTISTGTAPFSVTSTTVVPNLNASALLGGTWAVPGTIGSTTPNSGAFSTLTATGNVTLSGLLTSGTLAYSVCADSSGHIIIESGVNCYSATATSVTVGTTTVASGTNGSLLYDNAGTLGNETLASLLTSPPAIGAVSPSTGKFTTVNGLTETALSVGWSIAGGTTSKTLTVSNTMTLAGTDGDTYTMPNITSTLAGVVGTGTQALGTSSIGSGSCATPVAITVTGAAATDQALLDSNAADMSGVTGYGVSASGVLMIYKRITTNTLTITVCNSTGSTITPGALTIQWTVLRP